MVGCSLTSFLISIYIAQRWLRVQRGKNGFKNDGVSWKHHLSVSDVECWLTCFSLPPLDRTSNSSKKELSSSSVGYWNTFGYASGTFNLTESDDGNHSCPKPQFEELHSHKVSLVGLYCFWPNTSFKTKHAARVDTKPAMWPCVWLDSSLLSMGTGPTV